MVIWRNIFSYKAFICKLPMDSVYIRTLYLQRSFLGCLCILWPTTIFMRDLFIIFFIRPSLEFGARHRSWYQILYFLWITCHLVRLTLEDFYKYLYGRKLQIRILYYIFIWQLELYLFHFTLRYSHVFPLGLPKPN